ncbi:MAG TPA: TetR/AcrR family transcriptional regulator [Rhodoglobus sp.]|nr:TetR/AcrR family transcriptional regulator [Rhodoglobus sp.]
MSDRRSGPVRSEAARRAILNATATLFAQRGYDHLTMEGVAAEAGVGKQTIYRWWRSKGELVAECLIEGLLLPNSFDLPDTGDLRRDLETWTAEVLRVARDPDGELLMRSLIAAAAQNADIAVRLRDSLGGGASVEGRLRAGAAAGQLREDAPFDVLAEALIGAIVVGALARIPSDPARLVGTLLDENTG